jgi:S1-C subfamily serine protease
MQLSHLSAPGAVLVTEVAPHSPAEAAELKPRDIIVGFGESVVSGIDDLQRLLTKDSIDRAARLTVLRDGAQITRWIIPVEDVRRAQ